MGNFFSTIRLKRSINFIMGCLYHIIFIIYMKKKKYSSLIWNFNDKKKKLIWNFFCPCPDSPTTFVPTLLLPLFLMLCFSFFGQVFFSSSGKKFNDRETIWFFFSSFRKLSKPTSYTHFNPIFKISINKIFIDP